MAIEQGQTVNYVESPRDMELALIDVTDPARTRSTPSPSALLARDGHGRRARARPLTLQVQRLLPERQAAEPRAAATRPLGHRGRGHAASP